MKFLLAVLFSLSALPVFGQGAPPQGSADQPYTMEYYYKVQWGRQQEFLRLFLKNHYPLLKKQVETGRIVSVKIETPANHLPEGARWDYRVTIRFKNSSVATTANPEEEKMIKQLWPNQTSYKAEEQRRAVRERSAGKQRRPRFGDPLYACAEREHEHQQRA